MMHCHAPLVNVVCHDFLLNILQKVIVSIVMLTTIQGVNNMPFKRVAKATIASARKRHILALIAETMKYLGLE
jgi:hypothetical protein